MRTIKISEPVWAVIVENGKFGEQADDVLRRLLHVPADERNGSVVAGSPADAAPTAHPYGWKQRRATVRMTQAVMDGKLRLRFDEGPTAEWSLPPKDDHSAIRKVRDEAIAFVRKSGGTKGQEHAAIRALTSRGYHVRQKDPTQFE
jgi:hypothetical protein